MLKNLATLQKSSTPLSFVTLPAHKTILSSDLKFSSFLILSLSLLFTLKNIVKNTKLNFLIAALDPQAGVQSSQCYEGFMPAFGSELVLVPPESALVPPEHATPLPHRTKPKSPEKQTWKCIFF